VRSWNRHSILAVALALLVAATAAVPHQHALASGFSLDLAPPKALAFSSETVDASRHERVCAACGREQQHSLAPTLRNETVPRTEAAQLAPTPLAGAASHQQSTLTVRGPPSPVSFC
jgi:hypothetical protein